MASTSVTPFEYFTDSTNTINTKSDLILIVGEVKFYCHRLLLSLISPVFTRMLDGEFKERDQREIVLEGKTSQSILELLKNIYPQFQGKINNENVEDFLKLADEYMIEHLKKPCEDLLLTQLVKFKYVQIPMQQKLEQPSCKTTTTTDANNSSAASPIGRVHDDTTRSNPRQQILSNRSVQSKLLPKNSKSNDKTNGSLNAQPRYILFLDRTRLPTFFDSDNQPSPLTIDDIAMWLRRLRILYQIHRGKNYIDVINSILSILQFIPSTILYQLLQSNADMHTNDELLMNDIARARMFLLEDLIAGGDSHRPVSLSEFYRTASMTSSLQEKSLPAAKSVESDDVSSQILAMTMSSASSDDLAPPASTDDFE